MLYRHYGKDGPAVSVLGFGAMRLPAKKGAKKWGSVNFAKSTEVIRRALEAGVNFIDTHHQYHGGLSEAAVGRALKGWKGHKVYIQTKTPFYNDEPEEYFQKLLYEALKKLGVNRIDYLLFHSVRMDKWKARGRKFLKFSDWAITRGLVGRRGFSSHDTPENVRRYIDTGEFSAMLVSYNWMNPQMEEVIAHAASRGMGVAVMNPVGGGSLAASTPQILRLLPGAKSGPEVALRWALSTPGVTLALSGMSSVEQVEENVRIASRRALMTSRQRNEMKARLKRIQERKMQICTSCGYCMPCPHGVNIPQNFLLLNQAKFFGLVEWAKGRFAAMRAHKDGDRSALACRRCGSCLPKCPARVPIIEQLQETAKLLGA